MSSHFGAHARTGHRCRRSIHHYKIPRKAASPLIPECHGALHETHAPVPASDHIYNGCRILLLLWQTPWWSETLAPMQQPWSWWPSWPSSSSFLLACLHPCLSHWPPRTKQPQSFLSCPRSLGASQPKAIALGVLFLSLGMLVWLNARPQLSAARDVHRRSSHSQSH